MFYCFFILVNSSVMPNNLKLFTELRNDKSRNKPSFSNLTLTFSMIFLLFRVLDEFFTSSDTSLNEPDIFNHWAFLLMSV